MPSFPGRVTPNSANTHITKPQQSSPSWIDRPLCLYGTPTYLLTSTKLFTPLPAPSPYYITVTKAERCRKSKVNPNVHKPAPGQQQGLHRPKKKTMQAATIRILQKTCFKAGKRLPARSLFPVYRHIFPETSVRLIHFIHRVIHCLSTSIRRRFTWSSRQRRKFSVYRLPVSKLGEICRFSGNNAPKRSRASVVLFLSIPPRSDWH